MKNFLQNVIEGDLEAVQQYIRDGGDLNFTTGGGLVAMHYAVKHKHINIVKELLAAGAEVDPLDEHYFTPLNSAAHNGQADMVALLIAHGADVNRSGIYGMLPLTGAASHGHLDIMSQLLAAGAEIDAVKDSGDTALHEAASSKDAGVDAVKLLISAGAHTFLTDKDRRTAEDSARFNNVGQVVAFFENARAANALLFSAIAKGDKDAVNGIIQSGSAVNIVHEHSYKSLAGRAVDAFRPLRNKLAARVGLDAPKLQASYSRSVHVAAQYGKDEILDLLLKTGIDVNARDSEGNTALHIAAIFGQASTVKALLAAGADAYAINAAGHTALDYVQDKRSEVHKMLAGQMPGNTLIEAVKLGDIDAVRAHIANGADVNQQDKQSLSPLHIAAMRDDSAIAQVLIDAGADLRKTTSRRMTPLHFAARNGHNEMLGILIDAGASLHVFDADELTPLAHAAQKGHKEVVETLLSSGAVEMLGMQNMLSPNIVYTSARDNGHNSIVDLLDKFRSQVGPMNKIMDRYTNSEAGDLQAALVGGVAANMALNGRGATALHKLPEMGNNRDLIERGEILVAHGGKINARDTYGSAPLHYAAQDGLEEVLEWFLTQGADVNAQDGTGNTALHIAVSKSHDRKIKILLGAGADVNAQDKNGKTALHLAAQISYEPIAQVLLENGADPTIRDNNNQTPRDIAIKRKEEKGLPGMLEIFERMSNTPGSTVAAGSSNITAFIERLHSDYQTRL